MSFSAYCETRVGRTGGFLRSEGLDEQKKSSRLIPPSVNSYSPTLPRTPETRLKRSLGSTVIAPMHSSPCKNSMMYSRLVTAPAAMTSRTDGQRFRSLQR